MNLRHDTGPQPYIVSVSIVHPHSQTPQAYDRWLTSDDKDDPRLPLDLLHPLDSDEMKMVPANPAGGNWRNNGPEMLNNAYTN